MKKPVSTSAKTPKRAPAKKAAKKTAKKAAKKTAKKAAKKVAKTSAKRATGKAVKQSAKKAVKKAVKATRAPKIVATAALPPPPRPMTGKASTRIVHGETLVDDFAWLRAKNWRKVLRDPAALPDDIRTFLTRENAYARKVMAPLADLRKTLQKEMRGRIKEDDSETPVPDGPFEYFTRYRKGDQHPLVCRRPRGGGREDVMLDCQLLARGKKFFDLSSAAHSPDHTLLAWSADVKGSEYFTIRVRDLATGKDKRDRIVDTDGDAVWLRDASAFYYVWMDDNHRPCRVYRHKLGAPQSADELIYEERDPRWFVRIGETQSGAFGTIEVEDHETSETHLLDLTDANAKPRLVAPREERVRYDVEHHGDKLIILTNADGAEDFKIAQTPLDDTGRDNWRDVIPHRQGRMLTGMGVFARHLTRTELEDGLPRIVIRDIASGEEHAIAFDDEAYDLDEDEVLEFDTNELRFGYSSMKTPHEVWSYDMATRERKLLKRQIIPSGHDPEAYVTKRVFATSHDGAVVPISLIHKKTTKIDGKAPMLLEAYGAYGNAFEAHFSSTRLSLVDRGFVYAVAHVRGGTDKGWRWYQDGKLLAKPNTFHDFIASGRALAQQGYTREGRIVALGGSAGGMLMGAVANMAPELFAGIIADVPFVDVLNTMLDDTLPLTPPEWLEWGNPITDVEAFHAIRAYSPYDNVRAQVYPPILAEGGLTDPRVTYWEPAKWVARLRATMTGGGPIMLRTNMDAGHGGASGRFDRLKELAVEFAFALWAVKQKRARR